MRYIVLDHAHQLADQDFLAILLRLRELTGGCMIRANLKVNLHC